MQNIEFIKMVSLRGPNIWAYRPVIEAWVDIGELEDYPSNLLPGFTDRLMSWLPSLIEHRCSLGTHAGFLHRLREGTWAGHILEHVTLELQNLAGMPGGLGRARETRKRGVYKVVVRAWHQEVTRMALEEARDLVMAAIHDEDFDVQAAIARLRRLNDRLSLGPSTHCIVEAADDRDIPMIRLGDQNLVQLGYGRRQRRIWTAETDRTSAIAEGIACNKDLTRRLLASCGVPVPEGTIVESREAAWEAALEIGLPVVLKPGDGNHGRGVFTRLTSREEIDTAFDVAVEEGSSVIVERFVEGREHRLLVVGGRMVAAAAGEEACVLGDGIHSVAELIALQLNADPRRGNDEDHPLNLIRLDSSARMELGRQDLQAGDVPEPGRRVLIQRSGNVSLDVTDTVHADVAAAVTVAARVVGLDIAGIDVVAHDLTRPLEEQGGAIVEVNAGPGLLMHLKPAGGQPRPVGEAIVAHLFPPGDSGRIPIVGIGGSRGKTAVAVLLGRILQLSGRYTGVASSAGLFFGRRWVEKGDAADWEHGRRVLMNRAVELAVIETGPQALLSQGLPYDRCEVGVVTNLIPEDLFPELHVHDVDDLLRVLRTQVDVVLPGGAAVLNAEDERVAGLAPLCDGEVIFFGVEETQAVLAMHRQEGGRVVHLRGDDIILAQAGRETVLDRAAALSRTQPGKRLQLNMLAAVAAAWALGAPVDSIRAGLENRDMEPVETLSESRLPAVETSV